MSFGQRLVAAFFLLMYVLPLVGDILFGDKIFSIYKKTPLTPEAILMFAGTFVLFMVISRGPRLVIFPRGLAGSVRGVFARVGRLYLRYRLPFALGSFVFAVPYLGAGLSAYRYSSDRITDVDSTLGLIVIVLNLVATVDMIYWMFSRPIENRPLLSRRRVEHVLMSVLLLITANGTASMLGALAAMGFSLVPSLFHRYVFRPDGQTFIARASHSLIVFILVLAVGSSAWVAGEIIKLSSAEVDADLIEGAGALQTHIEESPEFVSSFGYYLVEGMSSYYHSALFTTSTDHSDLSGGASTPLLHPLQSFLFRLDYLTGRFMKVPSPEHGSLSRLNYALLSDEPEISERQGTSPGVLGSFNYVFPFPLSIFGCAIYLAWVARMTNGLLRSHRGEKLTVIGTLLLLFYMLIFFQSPFDFLLVIDNGFIFAALIAAIAFTAERSPLLVPVGTAKRHSPIPPPDRNVAAQ